MAATISPHMFLGERPGDVPPPEHPAADHESAEWQSGPYPSQAGLTALAAAIEGAAEDTISFAEDEIPEALRCRTALATLARCASRHRKQVALSRCSPGLRAIAGAAGWQVARAHVTSAPAKPAPTRSREAVGRSSEGAALMTQVSTLGRPSAKGGAAAVNLELSRLKDPRWVVSPAVQRARGLAGAGALAGRAAARPVARRLARRAPAATSLAVTVGVVVLALVALLAPSATVTLTPATQQVTLDLPIVVDPAIKKPDVAQGRLPGRAIDKEVAETAQIPTTGRKPAPDARAAGEVVFVNKTDKTVVVPKGTVVLAGSVRFATQSDLNVGGTIFSGPQPRISMQRVPVQALNGGSDGNVARYQINKIEGSPASQLDVQNDAPTRGGSDKTVAFVTADDRRKLQEALTRTVTDRLNQQLKSQLPTAKETAVAWNAQNPAIVEMTFSKNEGDEAPTLSLTMKVRYSATAFNNDAYNAFVKQMTAAKGGEAMPGFDVDQASVAAPPPEVQGVESGVIRLQAHARASAAAHLDAVTLRAAVVNQPLAQAQAYLSAVPGVTRADVQAWPAWLGRTPLLGWRVSVRVAP